MEETTTAGQCQGNSDPIWTLILVLLRYFPVLGVRPSPSTAPGDDVVVADKHPAGDRHQLAGGQGDRGVDERGAGLGSGGQASAADAHVEGTGCRGPSDAFAQQGRDVFPREGHQPSGSVQHRNRHRGKSLLRACAGARTTMVRAAARLIAVPYGFDIGPPNEFDRFYLSPKVRCAA